MANNKSSFFTYGVAAGLGIVAALILSRANVNTIKNDATSLVRTIATNPANPLAPIAIGTSMGKAPIVSRAFPDRSNLYNSIPSPMVENLVPFDITGRYSTVTGAYDNKCDYNVFP